MAGEVAMPQTLISLGSFFYSYLTLEQKQF